LTCRTTCWSELRALNRTLSYIVLTIGTTAAGRSGAPTPAASQYLPRSAAPRLGAANRRTWPPPCLQDRTVIGVNLRLVSADANPCFPRKFFWRRSFSGGEDSATGQCGASFQQTRTAFAAQSGDAQAIPGRRRANDAAQSCDGSRWSMDSCASRLNLAALSASCASRADLSRRGQWQRVEERRGAGVEGMSLQISNPSISLKWVNWYVDWYEVKNVKK
jgi:hypothetical protein